MDEGMDGMGDIEFHGRGDPPSAPPFLRTIARNASKANGFSIFWCSERVEKQSLNHNFCTRGDGGWDDRLRPMLFIDFRCIPVGVVARGGTFPGDVTPRAAGKKGGRTL